MLLFYLCGRPLPLSLFYPRWLLDGPTVVQSWKMSLSNGIIESASVVAIEVPESVPYKLGIDKKMPNRTSAVPLKPDNQGSFGYSPLRPSRYQDAGEQLIIDTAAKAVETLKSLPAGQKETFAFSFHDITSKLQARTSEMLASRQAMPAELPDPLLQPNVMFKAKRKRGLTGREAAEENEKDARRIRREAERNAQIWRAEVEAVSTQVVSHGSDSDSSDNDSDSDSDVVLSSHPPEASTTVQVPATAPASTIRSSLYMDRKHSRKFESQHTWDIAALEAKEQRRKDREAKANRTGTGRTKGVDALA